MQKFCNTHTLMFIEKPRQQGKTYMQQIYGWIHEDGELHRCGPVQHYQSMPETWQKGCISNYRFAYDAGWVRITCYNTTLAAYSSQAGLDRHEKCITDLAAVIGATKTELKVSNLGNIQ